MVQAGPTDSQTNDRHNDEYDDSDLDAYNAILKQLSRNRR